MMIMGIIVGFIATVGLGLFLDRVKKTRDEIDLDEVNKNLLIQNQRIIYENYYAERA